MRTVRLSVFVISVTGALILGTAFGFLVGFAVSGIGADLFEGMINKEEMAIVTNPKIYSGEGFQFSYPSNWTVDNDAPDFDPNENFALESPGSAFIQFFVGKGYSDPALNVQNQISSFESIMSDMAVSNFGVFGNIKGEGAVMTGKIFGLDTTVRAFSTSQNEKTIIVVQQYPDEDAHYVERGFAIIESTFTFE